MGETCDQRTIQLLKQLPTPCFTYQLYSYHKNRFKRKRSITQVKQIFQTRSQQFQHHSVVFTTRAKIVNLRYTIQEKIKSYLIIPSSYILSLLPGKPKQYFNFPSFKHFNSKFFFQEEKKTSFLIKPPSSLNPLLDVHMIAQYTCRVAVSLKPYKKYFIISLHSHLLSFSNLLFLETK